MTRLRHPDMLLILGLMLLTAGGAVLLAQPFATQLEPRDRQHFQKRHHYHCAFDALSAAAGAGMRVQSGAYTVHGQRILVGLGFAGAMLYVAAAWSAVRQLRLATTGALDGFPSFGAVFGAWLVMIGVCAGASVLISLSAKPDADGRLRVAVDEDRSPTSAVAAATDAEGGTPMLHEDALLSGAAVGAGLDPTGFIRDSGLPSTSLAWLGLIPAAGWPVWMLGFAAIFRRGWGGGHLFRAVAGVVVFWLCAAGLLVCFEMPLQGERAMPEAMTLASETPAARYLRSLCQVVGAGGIGIQTEQLGEREVSAGTQFMLGVILLIGGAPGSPAGGLHAAIAGLALAAALGLGAGARAGSASPGAARIRAAATRAAASGLLWTTVVALGLMLIQRWTGSAFDPRPGFSAAWLDAAGAVSGGSLSTGLIARITDPNLTGGIQHSADTYQYGLVWLMLALLIGRVLPVRILRQAAQAPQPDSPVGSSPVL